MKEKGDDAMPRLMEKADWVRTVANVGAADHVWCENVVGRDGALSFSIPENGLYQVIIVKLDSAQDGDSVEPEAVYNSIGTGRIRIGSMRNEVALPESFDQEFESLDEEVGTMFAGVAS